MNGWWSGLRQIPRPLALTLVGLLVVGLFVVLRPGSDGVRTVSASFSRAVQVYPGSEVRILGVPVGTVTAVIPEGNSVRVEMEYDDEYAVPQDAQAVIITPTLTADRFVQLTPAYTGGPELADGAEIAVEDTGTPIELDRIYRSLSDLTRALGPNGVNEDGTLDNVLSAGSAFLDGNGKKINTTIVNLGRAVKVFGDGSGDLFGTVRSLNEFSAELAANDAAVGAFMDDLGAVSQQLAGEKEELTAALANLAQVLGKVEGFVRDNRELLAKDVEDLTRLVRVLGREADTLTTILDIAPSSIGNLAVAFDPKSGTIGSRLRLEQNVKDLDGFLCLLAERAEVSDPRLACDVFEALLEPLTGQLPISSKTTGTGSGPAQVRYGDRPSADDLGGLLGGGA
jgi:phospholipid/cholesterol/gamma-HCH transport system substrate-binding protein